MSQEADKRAFVLWFTGLPCSGKSTIADTVFSYLKCRGLKVERLDGDTVREIFPSTGFSMEERNMHVKRIGFLASILERNGIFVVASFVSPYKESREFVRDICGRFIEVFVSTPLDECEKRDVKGMYRKARKGEIQHFTGVSGPYEIPSSPEIVISTVNSTPEESFDLVKDYIEPYI